MSVSEQRPVSVITQQKKASCLLPAHLIVTFPRLPFEHYALLPPDLQWYFPGHLPQDSLHLGETESLSCSTVRLHGCQHLELQLIEIINHNFLNTIRLSEDLIFCPTSTQFVDPLTDADSEISYCL